MALAAAPPAVDAAADDADGDAVADADADANAGADWVHRMRLHRRPMWAEAVPRVVVVARRRSLDTKAVGNQHHSDPAALVRALALAAVHPVLLAQVAHSDDPAAVHRNDGAAAVAVDHRDTLLPQLPVDSGAHVPHVLHALPHIDDAGDAYATRPHRCQGAPADVHDKRLRRRQQQLQRPHTTAAVVHDDPGACALCAGPSRVHDTCPH